MKNKESKNGKDKNRKNKNRKSGNSSSSSVLRGAPRSNKSLMNVFAASIDLEKSCISGIEKNKI